jgi:DNA-binding transcriptional LysR family regulator
LGTNGFESMDRLLAMEAFVAVVDGGSLTAAAKQMGLSGPMVGKHLRALESRLGVCVLTRTTRRQNLTEAGRAYYEHCKLILSEVRVAESSVEALRAMPRGHLRISAPVSFGTTCLAPALVDYMALYPDLSVELILSDRIVDLVEDGFDVAVRIGKLPNSTLVARALAPYAMVICASPGYLARAGTPQTPADLARHQCLGFAHWRHRGGWRLGRADADAAQVPLSRFICNHGPALRMAALQGFGLVMQPRVLLAPDVAAGRLVSVLDDAVPPAMPVHLVYPRVRQQLPKLHTFVDFALERFGKSLEGTVSSPAVEGVHPKPLRPSRAPPKASDMARANTST